MRTPAEVPAESALLQHIAKLPHGRASFKQLVKEFGVKGGGRGELDAQLARLTERGDLISLRSDQYALTQGNREYTVGRLSVHRDGYGFVVPDKPIEGLRGDVFIPPNSAGRAMHGDRVIAKILRIERDGKADGEIIKVLRRAHMTVVGECHVRKHGCFVKPHDERIQQWIEIAEGMEIPPSRATVNRVGVEPVRIETVEDLDGMIVNVEIVDFAEEKDESPIGRIIEVLGSPGDFGLDVEIIIRKFHIPHEFPADVLHQAQSFPKQIPEEEATKRRDFRDLDIVTIDGETARDFDDAVWVDKLDNGHYKLQVHIADVCYYVRPGSPIDREAALRGTSVYFPDRAIPMLPIELSTGLCSLRPDEDRLVLSALLEFDRQGDVLSQEFTQGVIRSRARMTYTNVFRILEGDEELRTQYAALVPRFELMQELALVLNRKRVKRGSIDFDMPEAMIEFDAEGDMTGVLRSPRTIANRLIEEFMLAANEAVAGHLETAELPSIYRIHEQPDPKRIMDFEEIASGFGYTLAPGALPVRKFKQTMRMRDGRKSVKEIVLPDENLRISSRAYQKLVAKLEGKPEERILTYLMLRSLKQARYSEENKGHFALAAEAYTHFTSPIRRYPDLIVHRTLSNLLAGRPPAMAEEQIRTIAQDSSASERRADEAERELVEWKKAKFMENRVGEDFDGLIISVTRFGFFVELEKWFIEGLVPIDSLPGDKYLFQESNRRIVGDRSRREFAMGSSVRVILDRVDAVERKLTFSVLDPSPNGKKKRRI